MKTYSIVLEVLDKSDSDGEDLEEVLQRFLDGELPEGLPSDMQVRIIEVTEEP